MSDDTTIHQLPLFPDSAFDEPLRTCTRCTKVFPATTEHFYLKEGKLETRCKPCIRELSQLRREANPDYNRDYYQANRERELERNRNRYQENREAELERGRQWREENPNYSHEYYEKNKERIAAQNKAYKLANLEWYAEYQKEYQKNNPEVSRKAARKYRLINPEKVREVNRQWREKNPEYNLERQRIYRREHPEKNLEWEKANKDKVKAKYRRYRLRHPEKARIMSAHRRARMRNAEGFFTQQDVDRMIKEQGGCCYYCHEQKVLTVDHKTPLVRGGSNYPDNLCMACRVCNSQKGAKTEAEYWLWLTVSNL